MSDNVEYRLDKCVKLFFNFRDSDGVFEFLNGFVSGYLKSLPLENSSGIIYHNTNYPKSGPVDPFCALRTDDDEEHYDCYVYFVYDSKFEVDIVKLVFNLSEFWKLNFGHLKLQRTDDVVLFEI